MLQKQDTDHVSDAIQYMIKLHVGAVEEELEAGNEFGLYKSKMDNPEASIMVPMAVNGTDMSFELDIGASKTVISERTWHKHRQACNKSLQDEQRKFRDLSVGDNVVVLNFSQGPKWLSGQVMERTDHTR